MIDSKIKLSVEAISLNVLAIESNEDNNDVIYLGIKDNQFYETKDVGAYKNVIYINDIHYIELEGPSAEIRLSLICLQQTNVGNIFIRGKRFL